jgi:hypothetical protein
MAIEKLKKCKDWENAALRLCPSQGKS